MTDHYAKALTERIAKSMLAVPKSAGALAPEVLGAAVGELINEIAELRARIEALEGNHE